jgi:glycosyltransferase involved in cell wall biosynthesis
LAQHLKAAHTPIEVAFSLFVENHDIEAFKATGLPIVLVDRPKPSNLWRGIWSLPKNLRLHADQLASLKPDAVIMTMNSPFAWPFIHALQKRGIRVLYVAHDAMPHPGDYAALWQRMTQDLLIKSADGVVTLSASVARRIIERSPQAAGKISELSLESIYPTNRTRLPERQAQGEPLRLLFYGRLLPYKGLDLLAQALAPLKSSPGWHLTIAGSGPLEGEVRTMFSGWPQVDLELGWVTKQRTDELFSTHHLLLCPYTEASQSGVVAEALSWAMPSVVMPTGALPEQVGFGAAGLVAETANADGFRRSLQSILDRPDRLTDLSHGASALLAQRQSNRGWAELVNSTATRSSSP